jgi:hypothetical protein
MLTSILYELISRDSYHQLLQVMVCYSFKQKQKGLEEFVSRHVHKYHKSFISCINGSVISTLRNHCGNSVRVNQKFSSRSSAFKTLNFDARKNLNKKSSAKRFLEIIFLKHLFKIFTLYRF